MKVYSPKLEQINDVRDQIDAIRQDSIALLEQHLTGEASPLAAQFPLTGAFALHREQSAPDLYGMIDAVYILYTLGELPGWTTTASRNIWAGRILACQDGQGWFTLKNKRGHSKEHATAYALGALGLLSLEEGEDYISLTKPISDLFPVLTDYKTFLHWIEHLQFRPTPGDVLAKNVGWHHIWRGSHIGGGVAAIIGMTQPLFEQWWPGETSADKWFEWYFRWLDDHVNDRTGYWQRAFWNLLYRKPTTIDMGGAVHFFWVYGGRQRPFSFPEQIIESTVSLQREDGLYKNYPYCIDLDGNYCINRSYLQLDPQKQADWHDRVAASINLSFAGVVNALRERPFEEIYSNLHGLPGALVSLVECARFPGFEHGDAFHNWNHPLDKVMWL